MINFLRCFVELNFQNSSLQNILACEDKGFTLLGKKSPSSVGYILGHDLSSFLNYIFQGV